ncbi:flagellar basal body P-ring formation chaperone FlgA [Halarsenatibacter silvermanii]|uniref:Flagella basal body P-ring formation protein FlgA n=1 Tax=Halarsenatibacter silvermanii TaxID=321763 RepID=A0A1G9ML27_9FIRM|nr:flagellar basal body P-ring formation chaperone FlgA [Halarsenatibacter silvermanii]SDL74834.1 flagella basal body P-ring formation protein FlgA [Halarsenatibacter silvermanii]
MKNLSVTMVLFMIILVFLGVFGSERIQAAEAVIHLPERAEVTSPEIYLENIADISADEAEKDIIRSIKIDRFTNLHSSKNLSRRLIELHVRNSGFSREEFQITGAEEVAVEIKSRNISESAVFSELKEKIEGYFYESSEYSLPAGEFTTTIELKSDPEEILIPAGEAEVKLSGTNFDRGGRVQQPIDVFIEGERWDRIFLELFIEHEFETYKLGENVERGQRVDDDQLFQERVRVSQLPQKPILSLEDELVQEGEYTRDYNAGQILTADMMEMPILIRHGDKISGRASEGGINITVTVIARDRGRLSDIITVENSMSGERKEARVLSEDMVEIVD